MILQIWFYLLIWKRIFYHIILQIDLKINEYHAMILIDSMWIIVIYVCVFEWYSLKTFVYKLEFESDMLSWILLEMQYFRFNICDIDDQAIRFLIKIMEFI